MALQALYGLHFGSFIPDWICVIRYEIPDLGQLDGHDRIRFIFCTFYPIQRFATFCSLSIGIDRIILTFSVRLRSLYGHENNFARLAIFKYQRMRFLIFS